MSGLKAQKAVITDYIEENQTALYRLAFAYVRNAEAAMDIVQDAIVQAITHASSLKSAEQVKPWLYRILVNESLLYLRRNKRWIVVEEPPESGDSDEPDWASHMDVLDALDTLEPTLKTIIILRFFEDMRLEDIARVTHANINTVKSRLYKALAQLRMQLDT